MFKYEIWDEISPINNVPSERVLKDREDLASNLGDIFLVIDKEYNHIAEICIGSNIKRSYRLNKDYTLEQVAEAYVNFVNASGILAPNIEEQSVKISILEQEISELKAFNVQLIQTLNNAETLI